MNRKLWKRAHRHRKLQHWSRSAECCIVWVRFHRLGRCPFMELGEFFCGFSNLFNIEETALRESGILREGQIQALCDAKKNLTKHLEDYERLAERGIWFVTPLDKEYPERLRHIHGYPMGLYVRGKLPDPHLPTAAVVGAPRLFRIWNPACGNLCGASGKGTGTDYQRTGARN